MEQLSKHGVFLPPNMQGLTDDQVKELKLVDEWGEKCVPSGGFEERRDEVGRRNGKGSFGKGKRESCFKSLVLLQRQATDGCDRNIAYMLLEKKCLR